MPVSFQCIYCHKTFSRAWLKATAKYCSRRCQMDDQKPPFIISCVVCGKNKQVQPSRPERQYCSNKCAQTALHPPIIKTCEICFVEYRIKPAEQNTTRFCSRKCKAVFLKQSFSGEKSPVWCGGFKASIQRYNKANPTKRAELTAKRRAKINAVTYEKIDRLKIMERDNYECYLCGKHLEVSEIDLDHVLPISKGGEHIAQNLKVSCKPCNSRKKDKLLQDFVCLL